LNQPRKTNCFKTRKALAKTSAFFVFEWGLPPDSSQMISAWFSARGNGRDFFATDFAGFQDRQLQTLLTEKPVAGFDSSCMKFYQYLSRQPRLHLLIASVALVLMTGLIDYEASPEVAFLIFYMVPIGGASWLLGRREGVFISVLATFTWVIVDLTQHPGYSHSFVPYWNGAMRLAIFLISSLLISEIMARKKIEEQLRGVQRQLEEQIHERTAELERNRLLEQQILEVSEREQCRVGQDLHDGLCQHLVSAAFAAAVLRARLAEKNLPETGDADQIADMLNDGLTQARKLARSFYPVRLEAEGLASALEEFADHVRDVTKLRCDFRCEGSPLLPDFTAGAHLYRIAQEAVSNAFKHACAKNICIVLSAVDNRVTLTVSDNGTGFSSVFKNSAGMGLHIMQYRARMIGASLDIGPGLAGGTTVVCSLKNILNPPCQHASH
jgi:signal transduction histidine kinase